MPVYLVRQPGFQKISKIKQTFSDNPDWEDRLRILKRCVASG